MPYKNGTALPSPSQAIWAAFNLLPLWLLPNLFQKPPKSTEISPTNPMKQPDVLAQ